MKRATPWVMLLALCSGFLLSNAYRTVATLVAPALQAELALSPQQLGLFAGIFHFAFGLLQMVMGIGIDLYGVRRTILWAFPWAIAGSVLTAAAPNFAGLLLGQAMIGIGCAPAFLVCTVLIAKRFAPEQFAAVSGIALGVGGLGMLLTGTPLAWVIEMSSWRMGFAVLAALSALAWGVMWWWVQDEQAHKTQAGLQAVHKAWTEFVALCRLPQTLGIVLLGCVTYASFITLRGLWLGPLMIERFGLSLVQAGHVALMMSVVALFGPAVFGRLDPKEPQRRPWIVRMTWLMALIFAVLAYSHVFMLTAALAVAMSFLGGYMVLQYADVRQSYTAEQTGRAMAVFTMAMFLGIALMQWCTGVVAAWAKGLGADTYTAVLIAVSLCLLLGSTAYQALPRARMQG